MTYAVYHPNIHIYGKMICIVRCLAPPHNGGYKKSQPIFQLLGVIFDDGGITILKVSDPQELTLIYRTEKPIACHLGTPHISTLTNE